LEDLGFVEEAVATTVTNNHLYYYLYI
jgi:hypothetical protein